MQDLNAGYGATVSQFQGQSLDGKMGFAVDVRQYRQQHSVALGFRTGRLALSLLDASTDDSIDMLNSYSSIDSNVFHSGGTGSISVSGFAADYQLGRANHLQMGKATLRSANARDREATYIEWSNPVSFFRATSLSRGSDRVGYAADLGVALGKHKIAYQRLAAEFGKRVDRVRYQIADDSSRSFWVDVERVRNPLYRDGEDARLMFTFKQLLGKKSVTPLFMDQAKSAEGAGANGEVDEQPTESKRGGWSRPVFIGLGVAAAAALGSSGDDSNDSSTRFRSERDAAFDVLNGINPTSIRENREYGGWVWRNADGSYGYSAPLRGEAASITLPNPVLVAPGGSRTTASYHTHAAFDPRFDNENFSPTDLESDREQGVNGYLGTPAGQFKFHELSTGNIFVLGTLATQ